MNEFVGNIKLKLDLCGEVIEIVLNSVSLITIIVGFVASFIKSLQQRSTQTGEHPFHTYFRRLFGSWMVVALELQLAADIVGTLISPTTQHLIELGAVALIRTFLNYFLTRELKDERSPTTGEKITP